MAKRCEICDKGPVVGRTVSHAHNVGPRRFEPNLQTVARVINGATKRIRVSPVACAAAKSSGRLTWRRSIRAKAAMRQLSQRTTRPKPWGVVDCHQGPTAVHLRAIPSIPRTAISSGHRGAGGQVMSTSACCVRRAELH